MTNIHYLTTRVAAGENPFTTLEESILPSLLRFAANQAMGYAARKGSEKVIAHGHQKYKDIISNAEKEAPLQTVSKLHALAKDQAGKPEGILALTKAKEMSQKHNIKIGANGPEVDKVSAVAKVIGKNTVNKNTWSDAMKAFKQGRNG